MAFNLPFCDASKDAYIAAYGQDKDKEDWVRYRQMQREGKDCDEVLYITMKRVRQYAPVTTYEYLSNEQRRLSSNLFSYDLYGEPITRPGPVDLPTVNRAGSAGDSRPVDHAGSVNNPDPVDQRTGDVPGSINIPDAVNISDSANKPALINPPSANIPTPTTTPSTNPPQAPQQALPSFLAPKYLKEYHTASIILQAAQAGTYPPEMNAIIASHHAAIGNEASILKSAKEIESDLKTLTGTTAKRNINKWAKTSGFQP